MKILACVDVGDRQIIQPWDVEDNYLIVRRFESKAIAIRLDKTRISMVTKVEELVEKLDNAPKGKEYTEAVGDSIEFAYLGSVNISDAVLL